MRQLENMIEKIYYKKRNGEFYTELTKTEILNKIDYNDPTSFLPFLKILDYPYIEYEWKNLFNRTDKQPNFGRYIALMRLAAFRAFSYEESDMLNERRK